MRSRLSAWCCAASLAAGPAHAAGPHVHGVGQLNLALTASELLLELRIPAADILGFEHLPRTPAQEAGVAEAMARLGRGERLFATPAAAACRLRAAEPRSPFAGAGAAAHGGRHDEHRDRAEHTEVTANYRFRCAAPPAHLEVRLFEAFPAIRRLDVQFVTEDRQGAASLTPAAPRLDFRERGGGASPHTGSGR